MSIYLKKKSYKMYPYGIKSVQEFHEVVNVHGPGPLLLEAGRLQNLGHQVLRSGVQVIQYN